MSSIDTSSWKEFKLDELFEKIKTEKISGKANDFPTCRTDEYTIPLLTAGADNQGLARYAKKNQCPTILKNVISISANGANTGVTFYQNNEFAVLQDAYAIKLKDIEIPNEQVGLFLASCISKILHGNFSWTYKAGWERIKDLSIKLPVKESEEIDWDYMQERIAELEQERIAELEQYLVATGLNDYELTDEDKEILATKLTDGGALQNSTSVNGCLKETKITQNFFIGNTDEHSGLFKQLRGKESAPNRVPDGIINMVNETSSNNGITKKAFSEHVFEAPAITVSVNFAQTVFLQDELFCASVNILILKSEWLKKYPKVGEYVATYLKKNNQRYTYSSKISKDRLNDTIISLPIQTDSQNNPIIDSTHMYHPHGYIPDWEYMKKYIKATEKVVIRDVVDWKDEMIEKTKEVVGGTYVKK